MQETISTLTTHPGPLFCLGLGVGMLSGMLGVGGGVVMTPILHLLGMSIPVAVGTTLTQMVASSFSGAIKHYKQSNISVIITLIFGIPGLLGVYLGKSVMLEFSLSPKALDSFTLVYGSFLIFLSFIILRRQQENPVAKPKSKFWAFGPQIFIANPGVKIPLLQTIFFSAGVGLISGLTGLGGGFFFMPIFSLVLGFPLKLAVGSSLGIVFLTSTMGAVSYIQAGVADLKVAFFLALGSIIGGYVGAALTSKISVGTLKKQFAYLVLAAAISVFLKYFDYQLSGIFILGSMAIYILANASLQVIKNSAK